MFNPDDDLFLTETREELIMKASNLEMLLFEGALTAAEAFRDDAIRIKAIRARNQYNMIRRQLNLPRHAEWYVKPEISVRHI